MNLTFSSSPNFDNRPEGVSPHLIILHYTGTQTAEEARKRFLDPAPSDDVGRISPHYFIDGVGKVTRFVEEEKRAWHAGKSFWKGEEDINGGSIGIEIWNTGHEYDLEEFRAVQIDALIELIEDIRIRWNIPNAAILGHSDIAPSRKVDPGERFPWNRLAACGIGLMPRITFPDKNMGTRLLKDHGLFIKALQHYGYDDRVAGEVLIAQFQRHFLPHIFDLPEKVGKLDLETAASFSSVLRQSKT